VNFVEHEIAVYVGRIAERHGDHVQILQVGPFTAGDVVLGTTLAEPADYAILTTDGCFAIVSEAVLEKLPTEVLQEFRQREGVPS
jgi:hypothetical protein